MNKKIALITGSSSGFGFLTTLALAKKGYLVIATMRDVSKSERLIDKAKSDDVQSLLDIRQLDVTSVEQINDLARSLMEEYGYIDVLINNAGFAQGGLSELVPMNSYQKQFATNFFGVVSVTQAFLPLLRKTRNGSIINISSISGRIGYPGLSPYVASKHALEGYSEALRLELKPFNIDVVLIEPGSYDTNVWEVGLKNLGVESQLSEYQSMTSRLVEEMDKVVNRLGDPNEVVEAILHAIRLKHPTLRYPVGKGIRLMISIKKWLPWKLWERIVQKRLTSR